LPDLNVLLNAVNEDSGEHAAARDWLQAAFAAPAGVGLSWLVLVGFVRMATRRGIFTHPLKAGDALDVMQAWLTAPTASVVEPTPRHASILRELLLAAGTAGNLTNDPHLAALAIEHGATLVSFDRDFDHFNGLDFERLRA
jgi:toxin-antitoxin system PIN domain toxin